MNLLALARVLFATVRTAKPGVNAPGFKVLMAVVALTMLFFALLRARYRLAVAMDAIGENDASDATPVSTLRPEPVR